MKDYQLTTKQRRRLDALIEKGEENLFYSWRIWRNHVRPDVLRLDRWECQNCRAKGKYRRAEIVHHVKHLRAAPALAVSLVDPETGKRQLVSLCKRCHEEEHPDALPIKPPREKPLTVERWE